MMLKKSLLAISIAAAVGTVNAGTLTASGTSSPALALSKPEAISAQSGVKAISLGAVSMTVSAVQLDRDNYTTLDEIRVTLTGATLSAASKPVLSGLGITYAESDITYPDLNTVVFDVPEIAAPAKGDTLSLSGLALITDGASPVSMKVEAVSKVAGAVIDSASGVVAQYVNEYSASVAAGDVLNGEITFNRYSFTNSESLTADTDSVDVVVKAATIDIADTLSDGVAVTTTLNGDFSFLDVDGDGTLEAGEGSIAGAGGAGAKVVVAKGLQSVSITDAAVGTKTFTVTLPADAKKAVVPAQSFTADVTVAYTNDAAKAGSTSVSGLKAGSWTLDGTDLSLQFMPFGSQYANSVTITNLSAIDGDVTVSITANGKTTTPTVVGTAKAKSVSQFGKEIAAIAAANGITEGYVSVTVNADNVEIVGVYYAKADGDRVLTK